jgi:hypothetical protein
MRQASHCASSIAFVSSDNQTARLAAGSGLLDAILGIPLSSPHYASAITIRARRLRTRFFEEELFADPAWDMLLDMLQGEIAQLRVPVSSLCIAAAGPSTTVLRWLKTMTDKGIFVRHADPHDGRRVLVELSREASSAMRRYFAEIGPAVGV